jgi:hypothetical protein
MTRKNYIPKYEQLSKESISLLEAYREWCIMNTKVSRESFKKLAKEIGRAEK